MSDADIQTVKITSVEQKIISTSNFPYSFLNYPNGNKKKWNFKNCPQLVIWIKND